MKDIFINKSILLVKNYNPTFDNTKLQEIKYGIEAVYMTFTKLVVVIIISLILKSFKETLFLLIFFNILRLTAFGLHASKSYICWISSILIFVLLPILAKIIQLPNLVNIILVSLCILSYVLYAPSDTKKRPIINAKKRKLYKILTVITAVTYLLITLITKNYTLKNCITFSMMIQTIIILPITYKFFRLPYRNYLNLKSN